jgi:GNAT superfamily N-acetyltransferase
MTTKPPHITNRPLASDNDFWRVRDLLIHTYSITPFGFNWEIRRWEGRRFHDDNPNQTGSWAQHVQLWETKAGTLVAAAHPEGRGDAHIQVHPDHQRKGLAKALMQEGLLRLKAIGAVDVTVGTGDMIPANRLYDSLGFTEAYKGHIWQKVF